MNSFLAISVTMFCVQLAQIFLLQNSINFQLSSTRTNLSLEKKIT